MTSRIASCGLALAGCFAPTGPGTPEVAHGVIYTYPIDQQLDVPTGARLVVSFADPVAGDAAVQVVGPAGPVDVVTTVASTGKTVSITSGTPLEPGTMYAVSIDAEQLFRFTTRDERPRSGAPRLIAINGSDPARPGTFRPIFETSTLQLVVSEPLDPRSVFVGPGGFELVDTATHAAVPVRLVSHGIHVALDPLHRLAPNGGYELRLGDQLRDASGERVEPIAVPIVPIDSMGSGSVAQTLRIREDGDPLAAISRLDVGNTIELAHPVIGAVSSAMRPGAMEAELGDAAALGGPIAFAIPRGQRLASSSLDIRLAGAIPSGLTSGDIQIELLTDGSGWLYRNRYRPEDALPDDEAAPLAVDLTLDLGVFATDAVGNAVLAQSALGVQLTGIAMIDEGALALEVLGSLDVGLLGVAQAPANLVLDLVTDPAASAVHDAVPPELSTALPEADTQDLAPDAGIELGFTEPIDIDRARAGGIVLVDGAGSEVPAAIEIWGSTVVVRPRVPLADGARYGVVLSDVADVAGNPMSPRTLSFATPAIAATSAPMSVVSASPGTACALVAPTATAAGRCAAGQTGDAAFHPFELAAGEPIDVVFDQPVDPRTLTLGAACDTGSVRVEHVDAEGKCTGAVRGSLLPRRRGLAFVPDAPWIVGERYRVRLISGGDATCSAGEICGANGRPASFDPLAGKTANGSGGPELRIDFVATAPGSGTRLFAEVAPATDLNASGRVEPGEQLRDANRAAVRVASTSGIITAASFAGPDCVPSTHTFEACMYMLGAMPAELESARTGCALPDGTTADTCVPVQLSAQQIYATSLTMTASALGIPITAETGISVLRVREPETGPLEGFIVERDGQPTMIVALDLYMDAPDMALPIGTHDLHSKPLSVLLSGPVTFQRDGRIAITLRNTADMPIAITITAPLGITGGVQLVVPQGEMKLQLLSRAAKGSL